MTDVLLLTLVFVLLTTLPLAWKWQLGVARTMSAVVAIGLVCTPSITRFVEGLGAGPILQAVAGWAGTMCFSSALLLYFFYRDPRRTPPEQSNAILSPADGMVRYLRESSNGNLPVAEKCGKEYPLIELTKTPLQNDAATVLGIAMSFLDVHVNRAPIRGRVILHRHFPGKFGSLRREAMVFENERATTIFQSGTLEVAVVQIASRLVRQIAVFVREGEEVTAGQRFGAIRLGSQVDVVLPRTSQLRVLVREGQIVRAGETILAIVEPAAAKS